MAIFIEALHFAGSRRELHDAEAVKQLEAVARVPGVIHTVGLPDLHAGKGGPVGCAAVVRGVLYPHLIGNDIGCGMSLFQTDVAQRKLKLGKLEDRIYGLEDRSSAEERAVLDCYGLPRSKHDRSLGTIGGGNHFAELQVIDEIKDESCFQLSGIDREAAFVLVHSGSRGLGEEIYWQFVAESKGNGLEAQSEQGRKYFEAHQYAVNWAKASRELIASRFMRFLKGEARKVLDLTHNFIEPGNGDTWIHRKGAISAKHELAIIPGSRGTHSYLVQSTGDKVENAFSLSHGAGRRWRRSECRKRLSDKYERSALLRTRLGGRVVCEDTDLLYEEAPEAYKNIRTVIDALVSANLIRVVATLRPLLTYKTRRR